jgi:hypothetical protein
MGMNGYGIKTRNEKTLGSRYKKQEEEQEEQERGYAARRPRDAENKTKKTRRKRCRRPNKLANIKSPYKTCPVSSKIILITS